MTVEYPKMLYGEKQWLDMDDHITVENAEEEKLARDAGFKCLDDIPEKLKKK